MTLMARLLLWVGLGLGLVACGRAEAKPEIGAPAPWIRLPDPQGRTVELDDFSGQVVLLNFWALWCEPCKAEMADFQAAQEQYGPEGFAVITVDLGDSPERVAAYIEEHGYSFTTLVDTSLEMAQLYDTRVLPLSLLIDRAGLIRLLRVTPFEPGQLTSALEALLEEVP